MRNSMKRKHGSALTTQTLLDFDLGESSSDSDFRIEDHDDESDDFSIETKDNNDRDDDDDDEDDDDDDDEDDRVEEQQLYALNGFAEAKKQGKIETVGADDANPDDNDGEDEESATDGGGCEPKEKVESCEYPITAPCIISTSHAVKTTTINEKNSAVLKMLMNSICCACLGDRSDDHNEIVECDGCGVTVHEGCYGVSDCTSVSSTTSSCSTEPWFCDACKAGVVDPECELCPNRGGIFKETDVGKWVHLVCALYVPGVAFGEVDQLSSVTLFEMPYNKWGAKTCSLCDDTKLTRTGVCIGCDAGMCKTYFHVTCAQYHGLLSEAHSEEADQADPFYAHCKLHSDKSLIKHRKRNYNAIKMKVLHRHLAETETLRKRESQSSERARIERKLAKHRKRYLLNKETKNPPWVPTQKIPRLMITSATACKKLLFKARLMGLDMAAIEFQESQIATLGDVRKKWHISPAFSVEFIGYYLDRALRLREMKQKLQEQTLLNQRLLVQQHQLRSKYDLSVLMNQTSLKRNESYRDYITKLYDHIQALAPNKILVPFEEIGKSPQPSSTSHTTLVDGTFDKNTPHSTVIINTSTATSSVALCQTPPTRTMTVPTAAALKMGVGFPLQNLLAPGGGKRDDTGRILSTQCKQNSEELLNECGICKRCHDQHLLAKCDTCYLYYHLGCLNPPLTRHPKKSKLYGWQCSECDRSDDSNPESIIIPKTPRKSRTRYSKDGTIVPYDQAYTNEQLHDGDTNRDYPYSGKKSAKSSTSTGCLRENASKRHLTTAQTSHICLADKKSFQIDSGKIVKQETVPCSLSIKPESPKSLSMTTQEAANVSDSVLLVPTNKIPGKRGRKKKVISEAVKTKDMKLIHQKIELVEKDKLLELQKQKEPTKDHGQQFGARLANQGCAGTSEQPSCISTVNISEDKVGSIATISQCMFLEQDKSTSLNISVDSIAGGKSCGNEDNIFTAGTVDSNATETISTHHKHSKRRKEKHRNRSPNTDRIVSKDHKRKRKRRNHDYDLESLGDGVDISTHPSDGESRPRIKIKIKSVLDGSNTHTTQIFYVRDEPSPEKIPECQLISNSADSSSHMQVDTNASLHLEMANTSAAANTSHHEVIPQKIGRGRFRRDSIVPQIGDTTVSNIAKDENLCDVCQSHGTTANIVQCDECHKNYHFGCLDPPLKKSPKRRGYSWHCADCDPTDVEN